MVLDNLGCRDLVSVLGHFAPLHDDAALLVAVYVELEGLLLELSDHSDVRHLEVSDAQLKELQVPSQLLEERALTVAEERVQLSFVVVLG